MSIPPEAVVAALAMGEASSKTALLWKRQDACNNDTDRLPSPITHHVNL